MKQALWGVPVFQEPFTQTHRPEIKGEIMKKITLMLLAVVLAACSGIGQGDELSQNRKKWRDVNITHYRFQLTVGCFCPVAGQNPFTVEVQNGEIISMVDTNGDEVSAEDPMNDFVFQYATIDRLFSKLDSDSVRDADKLTVTYDPTYGFPSDISIDFIELAMDDELYLSASAFEPLP